MCGAHLMDMLWMPLGKLSFVKRRVRCIRFPRSLASNPKLKLETARSRPSTFHGPRVLSVCHTFNIARTFCRYSSVRWLLVHRSFLAAAVGLPTLCLGIEVNSLHAFSSTYIQPESCNTLIRGRSILFFFLITDQY